MKRSANQISAFEKSANQSLSSKYQFENQPEQIIENRAFEDLTSRK